MTRLRSAATSRVPGLDGLRALAVGTVVVLHTGVALPGGDIGVDLFMVLSGYLITTLLLGEHQARGRISIGQFYLRRALRLYPALILLVVGLVVTVVAVDDGSQFELTKGFLLSCLLVLLYLSDIAIGWGAWPEMAAHAPVLHTWSLAVEEHYYLLWAPLLAVLVPRLGVRRLARWLLVAVAVMTAWTFALGAVSSPGLARVLYSPDTRGVGLVLGSAMAAYLWGREDRAVVPRAIPWFALALFLALSTVSLVHRLDTDGLLLLVAALSAVLIAGVLDADSAFSRLWAWPPLTFVGRRAYGIYLWHFPVFHFISTDRLDLGGAELGVLKILVTMVIVEVSYDLVEKPALRLRHRFTPRRAGSPEVVAR